MFFETLQSVVLDRDVHFVPTGGFAAEAHVAT